MDVAPTGFSQWFMTVLYLSDVLDFLSSDVVSSLENPTYFYAMEASSLLWRSGIGCYSIPTS